MKFCKVAECRYPYGHVTKGHKCGSCGLFGHGQIECNNDYLKSKLMEFNDILPNNKKCKIKSCKYSLFHTTEGHYCITCKNFGHDCNDYYYVECPICRMDNKFMDEPQKVFGISNQCPVCVTNNIDMVFPICGHACICRKCFILIKNNATDEFNNNTSNTNSVPNPELSLENLKKIAEKYMENLTGNIYLVISTGNGCAYYFRRGDESTNIEHLYMHSDDWNQSGLPTSKQIQFKDFIKDYNFITYYGDF